MLQTAPYAYSRTMMRTAVSSQGYGSERQKRLQTMDGCVNDIIG